ncbi:MAG: hypothetical protein KA369_12890 [Spirochaetes bacterium]|nr:hypothetical protein [Spirochaetota bacterium]
MPDGRCVMVISCIRNAKQEALLLVTEPGGRLGKYGRSGKGGTSWP